MKKGLILLTTIFAMTMFISSCDKDEEATCTDGIKNGTETAIDCGGDCSPCSTTTATCTDGIQNGTETGVDCGGTCAPCSTTSPYDNYYFYDGNYYELNDGYVVYINNGPADIDFEIALVSSTIDFISYNQSTDNYNMTGAGNVLWISGYNSTDEITNGSYSLNASTIGSDFLMELADIANNVNINDYIDGTAGSDYFDTSSITISEENGEKVIEMNGVLENGKTISAYFKGNLTLK